ncbi:MAG TPA: Uma2 family endonuclease [Thermomicrobiales bacterium]|jgi:Uma2 family endonuclease
MATTAQPPVSAELQPRLLTLDEFDRMKESGIFAEKERVELLDGVVITMSTVGGRHVRVINRIAGAIQRLNDANLEISVQNPLRIGERAEFLPDIAVLRAAPESNAVPTADEALLVIEVADSSRNYDRATKLPRYAAAGIPEALLIDLVEDRIIRYSGPRSDGYRQITLAGRGEQLPSAILPGLILDVDTILGPAASAR